MSHGGKRQGAGRPPAKIDPSRVAYFLSIGGLTRIEMAARFGVEVSVLNRFIKKQKESA